jgi:hypothetical protein
LKVRLSALGTFEPSRVMQGKVLDIPNCNSISQLSSFACAILNFTGQACQFSSFACAILNFTHHRLRHSEFHAPTLPILKHRIARPSPKAVRLRQRVTQSPLLRYQAPLLATRELHLPAPASMVCLLTYSAAPLTCTGLQRRGPRRSQRQLRRCFENYTNQLQS